MGEKDKTALNSDSGALHPTHVLIVDDEKSVRRMLQLGVRHFGYECSVAENADEALQLLKGMHVDIVVTDIRMPDLDGLELTRMIKERYDADVIVMTGYYEDFTYEGVIEKGASDFIEKPIKMAELMIRLKRVLRERDLVLSQKRINEKLTLEIKERKLAEKALRVKEKLYRNLVENINDVIYTVNTRGHIDYISPVMEHITQYKADEITGKPFMNFVHPDDLAGLMANFERKLAGHRGPYEFRILDKDGSIRHVSISSKLLYEKGQPIGLTGIITDITKRKESEEALRRSEEKYRNLFDSSRDGIIFTEMKGGILDVNKAYLDMVGYDMEEMTNLTYQQLTPPKWLKMEEDMIQDQILKRGYSEIYEKEYIRKDGMALPISIRVWLIKNEQGDPMGMWGIARDITEQKRVEAELHRLSYLDGLTEIANRRYFEDIIDHEWRRGARYSTPLSLVMADIDFFKDYNDTCGHQSGDDCLRQVAGALKGTVRRPGDIVARYGGEEFAIILPNTDLNGSVTMAEAMRSNVKALDIKHPASKVCDLITISLGVATAVPGSDSTLFSLISAADNALYHAKRDGRNRVKGSDLMIGDTPL
ncbi:MAG: PAS domain S-box protein [Pseudomonadota bacterium]